jgi:N utilization substance protein A
MVVLNKEALDLIKLFTAMTKAEVKHCFLEDSNVVFVVEEHQAGRAVGKNGVNVKRLSRLFRKVIKIIEYSEDPLVYLRNILFPLIPKDVKIEEKKIIILTEDNVQKGRIFGREKMNFKKIKEIFNNDFKDFEITVE